MRADKMEIHFPHITNGIHTTRRKRRNVASKRILIGFVYLLLLLLSASYGFAHHDTVTRDNKAWLSEQLEHDCYHLASDITYAMRQMTTGQWTKRQLIDVAQQKADIYEAMCK